MTKQEFELRTVDHVSDEQFAAINEMYMAAGQMDKDDFCTDYMLYQNSKLLHEYFQQAMDYKAGTEKLTKIIYELADCFIEQAYAYSSPELRAKAIEILGTSEYLRRILEKGYNLWELDRVELQSMLGGRTQPIQIR